MVSNGSSNRTAMDTQCAPPTPTSILRREPYHSIEDMQEIDGPNILSNQYVPRGPSNDSRQSLGSFKSNAATGSALHIDLDFSTPRVVENNSQSLGSAANAVADTDVDAGVDADAGPSPSEANVVGAVSCDGNLAVHGVSSIFHHPARLKAASGIITSTSTAERKAQNQASKARLIANAALQQQRESILLRNSSPGLKVDLDGVNAELAFHLLSLHWNRQHYTYLISYRPAIMDSLINNGPYVNTLLLNAIYFSSSILSDRIEIRSNPNDPQSAGLAFYNRFRTLLADNVDKPSIPTSAALLLCGAALVSSGRPSAGWVMCGIAYRMIIDLGCHMTVDSRPIDGTSEIALLSDLDVEIRKRLFWGAFLTDATQSLYFGRPPCFRASQARVPQLLLDTFEELEHWTPYVDPLIPAHLPPYPQRPAYAISTFNTMIRLFSISSKIVHSFYSIVSLKDSPQHIRTIKVAAELELDQWRSSIPPHLQFDPETDCTPPPHQVTPL